MKAKGDNKITIKLPQGCPARTDLYLYLEGTEYPVHMRSVAVIDNDYAPVNGNYERGDKMCAFTFDCAYGETNTDWLLDVLDEYNIKCTFFMTGNWMGNHGRWIERMIEAGHEIGSHSVSHPRMIKLDTNAIRKQIEPTVNLMLEKHGYRIHLFRPPYGATNAKINTISRFYGLEVIRWGQTSKDATETYTGEAIRKLLLKETEPGDIILCHNGAKELKKYLKPVLDELIARGYTFCTVSELMGWDWDDTYTDREARIAAGETFE